MRKPTFLEILLSLLLVAGLFGLWRLYHPVFGQIEFYAPHPEWCFAPERKTPSLPEPTERSDDGAIDVLFVGNSHTFVHDVPNTVRTIAEASGERMRVEMYAPGGYSLPQHWNEGAAAERILSKNWDAVVLQGQSGWSMFCSKELSQAVAKFKPLVRAVGARPLLYMVWVRADFESNQDPWTASYLLASKENSVNTAPAGYVWQQLELEDFPYELRSRDGNHATEVGAFVNALVITASLLPDLGPADLLDSLRRQNPKRLSKLGLSEDDLSLLRKVLVSSLADYDRLEPSDLLNSPGPGLDFLGAVFYQHGYLEDAARLWKRRIDEFGESEAVSSALSELGNGR